MNGLIYVSHLILGLSPLSAPPTPAHTRPHPTCCSMGVTMAEQRLHSPLPPLQLHLFPYIDQSHVLTSRVSSNITNQPLECVGPIYIASFSLDCVVLIFIAFVR